MDTSARALPVRTEGIDRTSEEGLLSADCIVAPWPLTRMGRRTPVGNPVEKRRVFQRTCCQEIVGGASQGRAGCGTPDMGRLDVSGMADRVGQGNWDYSTSVRHGSAGPIGYSSVRSTFTV